MAGQSAMDITCSKDRFGQALAERAEMTDVVQMVMSDKNGRERVKSKIMLLKRLLQTAQAHAGIYYDAIFLIPKKITVTAASTGKT